MATTKTRVKTRIGILALQGDFREHREALERLGVETSEVRLPRDLEGVSGLIIPGGESTTISRLMQAYGLEGPIRDLANQGTAVWGTCAGMIVIAKEATDLSWKPFGFIDIGVRRNAFGRQVDSFEEDLEVPTLGQEPFHAIFIRAPLVDRTGKNVQVLARLASGSPVAARAGKVLATAFHPELTHDTRFHELFLRMAEEGLPN